MIRYKLSYLDFFLFLLVFSILFFDRFLYAHLREWKSGKMLLQSKVYLDESIEQGSGLLRTEFEKPSLHSCLIQKVKKPLRTATSCSSGQILRWL